MTKAQLLEHALKLDVDDRLDLAESLRSSAEDGELPDWQKELLDARLADAKAHPEDSVPWKEALTSARERLRARRQ